MTYVIFTLTLTFIRKEKIQTSTTTTYFDLNEKHEEFFIFEDGLNFGFAFWNTNLYNHITLYAQESIFTDSYSNYISHDIINRNLSTMTNSTNFVVHTVWAIGEADKIALQGSPLSRPFKEIYLPAYWWN